MLRAVSCLAFLLLAACATAPAPACAFSAADQAWVSRAIEAWRFAKRNITHIRATGDFRAVFYDAACMVTSDDALTGDSGAPTWRAVAHTDTVTLPDGEQMPVSVTSYTSAEDGRAYFVMSTPSVWSAAGVPAAPLDLETLMVFVLLHEGSHVVQAPTYGSQIGAVAERFGLPEAFNDDSLQHRFGRHAEFAASVTRETELFIQAANATDDAQARRLAREARDMMKARAAHYYLGADANFAESEGIWLTFEGAGQWAGYQWLIHPQGMALDPELARRAAMRSSWWSQNQGLALTLVLDRLGVNWTAIAFGDGSQTVLDMLDAALA